MAESVDALVSNTSGATHPGSIPGLGTETEKVFQLSPFFYILNPLVIYAGVRILYFALLVYSGRHTGLPLREIQQIHFEPCVRNLTIQWHFEISRIRSI